jgi:chromate transporter
MQEWQSADWVALALHFAGLSLLGVGGAVTTLPEMHRYLVDHQHWLDDATFGSSVALAQAAPGPNVLFVALMGWNIGMNVSGGLQAGPWAWWVGLLTGLLALFSILLPSSVFTFWITQWAHRNRELRSVRAFKTGMAPMVIGLMMATGWLLQSPHSDWRHHWPLWAVTLLSTLIVWKTRTHLLWLLGAGALLGMLGWV